MKKFVSKLAFATSIVMFEIYKRTTTDTPDDRVRVCAVNILSDIMRFGSEEDYNGRWERAVNDYGHGTKKDFRGGIFKRVEEDNK